MADRKLGAVRALAEDWQQGEILQLIDIIQRLSAHLAPELVTAIEADAVPPKT